jgi:hypothetical protein
MYAYQIVELNRGSGKAYPRTIATVGPFLTVVEANAGLRQYLTRWPGSWYVGKAFRLVAQDASLSSPLPQTFVNAPAAGGTLGPNVQPMARRKVTSLAQWRTRIADVRNLSTTNFFRA